MVQQRILIPFFLAERCAAGKYYDAEADLCRPCGHGSYQPREGAFTCMACPRGQTTRATEAVSAAECRDDCPSGKFTCLCVTKKYEHIPTLNFPKI